MPTITIPPKPLPTALNLSTKSVITLPPSATTQYPTSALLITSPTPTSTLVTSTATGNSALTNQLLILSCIVVSSLLALALVMLIVTKKRALRKSEHQIMPQRSERPMYYVPHGPNDIVLETATLGLDSTAHRQLLAGITRPSPAPYAMDSIVSGSVQSLSPGSAIFYHSRTDWDTYVQRTQEEHTI
ncbi:hypothetical protein THRCLA_20867 [Thraustotheca clavata]|uniref:Uncharacterized protein n=1 Tax=Thraustotheca clavata TaxID=74557 RepID=A0A1W0A2L4_9STRA|nr:hypothetical protein THRCLA_20867 [Thraustotheca clavata]